MARFQRYARCTLKTLLGSVVYERAYYHCAQCHTGIYPTDEEFGITEKLSPGATEVISLVGILEPFEEGARETLPRLCGLNVSASTIQRVTEAVGTDVAQRRAEGEATSPPSVWDWNRDAQGESVAYIGLDATGVRQQGLHGEKAEGRMPWVGLSSIRSRHRRSIVAAECSLAVCVSQSTMAIGDCDLPAAAR